MRIAYEILSDRPGFLSGRDLREYVKGILRVEGRSMTNLDDFFSRHYYLFQDIILSPYKTDHVNSTKVHDIPVVELVQIAAGLANITVEEWKVPHLEAHLKEIVLQTSNTAPPPPGGVDEVEATTDLLSRAKKQRLWNRALHHYLRWALTEGNDGPTIANVLAILGRNESLSRLSKAASLAGHGCSAAQPASTEAHVALAR